MENPNDQERRQNWQGLHDAVTRLVTFNQIAIAIMSLAVPTLVGYLVWDHNEQNKTQLALVESIAKVRAMDTLGSVWVKDTAAKHHGNIACHFIRIKPYIQEGEPNGSKDKKSSSSSQRGSSWQLVDNSDRGNRERSYPGGAPRPERLVKPNDPKQSQWRAEPQDQRLGHGRDNLAYGIGGQAVGADGERSAQ